MFKNVASQQLTVFAFDSATGLPQTGDAANITAYVNKDYAGLNVLSDTSAAEVDATNAKGYYTFTLTQSETNADTLLFTAKSSSSGIVVLGVPAVVFTVPANFTSTSLAHLDADVSSRSTYAGGDTSGTTTLLSRLTSTRAGNLDDLDAAISTRLATSGYTAPDNADIAAIKAKTDNLPASPAATGDIPTATQNADALLKRDMSAVSGEASRSPLNALRLSGINKQVIATGTLTVYKENDATTAFTRTLGTDAGAEPIISVTP